MKIPDCYKELARTAKRQGWVISQTNNNHLRWVNPEGRSTFTPGSPSVNGTGIIRIKSKLKRAGLRL